MKKIPLLFKRNYTNYGGDHLVTDGVVRGSEWVVRGEGVATRKFDGTACMLRGSKLYRRCDCKHGKKPPQNFEPCQSPDEETGHWPGWVPVGDGPEDKWYRAAYESLPDGTYELCGPHINGNPEKLNTDTLILHGSVVISDAPRTFSELREWFVGKDIEGIVWHHPDGRMVKIKARDFGLVRAVSGK